MNKLNIQSLLDELYEKPFLEVIQTLSQKESEYKKSDFYKQTKIPLNTLFEKYFQHRATQFSMKEKIEDFIREINFESILDSALVWIENEDNQARIEKLLNKVLQKFNLDNLQEESEELKNFLEEFKKLT